MRTHPWCDQYLLVTLRKETTARALQSKHLISEGAVQPKATWIACNYHGADSLLPFPQCKITLYEWFQQILQSWRHLCCIAMLSLGRKKKQNNEMPVQYIFCWVFFFAFIKLVAFGLISAIYWNSHITYFGSLRCTFIMHWTNYECLSLCTFGHVLTAVFSSFPTKVWRTLRVSQFRKRARVCFRGVTVHLHMRVFYLGAVSRTWLGEKSEDKGGGTGRGRERTDGGRQRVRLWWWRRLRSIRRERGWVTETNTHTHTRAWCCVLMLQAHWSLANRDMPGPGGRVSLER